MRDETLRFLLEGSGVSIEDEIHIFIVNYKNIIYMYRVIQVQVITDQERRKEAHNNLVGLRDEEEDMKARISDLKKELQQEKRITDPVLYDDDLIKELQGKIKGKEKDLKSIATDIEEQKSLRDEERPVTFYMQDLDSSDISTKIILKHWKVVQKIERIDYKIRRWMGGKAFKASNKYAEFVGWAAKNTGSDSLDTLEDLCKQLPEYARDKFYPDVETHKHIPKE